MVNYSNGKIYKIEPIVEHDEGDIYIGSTTKQYLSQRMDKHRSEYKRWKKGTQKNKTMSYDIFDKYGLENCQIVLIECVDANSKDELHAREKHFIKLCKCVNRCTPNRTHEDIVEYFKVYNKEYKINNKEKIIEHYKNNIEKRKEYYHENQIKISKHRSQKITCECGSSHSLRNKALHLKSLLHQNFIKLKLN